MRIALLSPSGAMHRYNGSFGRSLQYAPLTHTTLAALVPEELDATVKIYDESVERIPVEIDADIIGITAITGTANRCYKWADYFRKQGKTIVLGGIHPTLMPEEAAEFADSVVIGNAERTWAQLLRDYSTGNLQKFYYQSADFTLADRPQPKRELLSKNKYITTSTVEATKGCHHSCTFCAIPAAIGQDVYTRPVRNVIEEIERLKGRFVTFVDVNLITDKEYAKELFRQLAPLKKKWFGLTTCAILEDEELFDLIVASGCRGLLIGFESPSPDSLKNIQKSFHKTTDYALLVKKLHDNGISINGTFLFGTDSEDADIFERTVEMVQELRIDLPRYAILTPFPGSQLFSQLDAAGRIIERDWSMYDVEHCVYRPTNMSPEKLEEGLQWAWRETYKLSHIASRIASPHNFSLLAFPLNVAYRKYALKLPQFTREVMTDNSDVPVA